MITQYNTTLMSRHACRLEFRLEIKKSASSIKHQGNDDKLRTGDQIKLRQNTYIGTWIVRTNIPTNVYV